MGTAAWNSSSIVHKESSECPFKNGNNVCAPPPEAPPNAAKRKSDANEITIREPSTLMG
jgi:hypothetical protein